MRGAAFAAISCGVSHLLDRAIWHSLATVHAELGEGDVRARRFVPAVHAFAAARDDGPEAQAALAALARPGAGLVLVEAAVAPTPPGLRCERVAALDQMLLDKLVSGPLAEDAVDLGAQDAADMLALAGLTRPGPFFPATHRMGGFVGIRQGGQLIAMAGERLRLPGFTEVSAVCTHPDHRGRGLAPALMRVVIGRGHARGDAVFLHAYPDNPAIALYQAMGFRMRRRLMLTQFGC